MLVATRNSVYITDVREAKSFIVHNQILSKIVYAPFSITNILFFSLIPQNALVLYLFHTENVSGPPLYPLNLLISRFKYHVYLWHAASKCLMQISIDWKRFAAMKIQRKLFNIFLLSIC